MALDLAPEQLDRYSRHVIMDDVGPEGQAALLETAVLFVGAGGLGYGIYLLSSGGQPVTALVFLLLAAVVLTSALRN